MSDFTIMANTPQQNRLYLRKYLQAEVEQKIRLEAAIALWADQYDTLTESVVDQSEVIRSMESAAGSQMLESIKQAKDRLVRIQGLKANSLEALNELRSRNEQMIKDGQAHMVELSNIEIEQGGFVALIFGLRDEVEFDEVNNKLTFKPSGSAESIIGTRLSSWKDSSQLTIIKSEAI